MNWDKYILGTYADTLEVQGYKKQADNVRKSIQEKTKLKKEVIDENKVRNICNFNKGS